MASASAAAGQSEITDEQLKFFETKIRPQLARNCYGCHSQKSGKLRGGLALDTRQATLAGGNSGPAVVPHDPEDSELWISIADHDMPPSEPLPDDVIADFKKWIEMGAPDPRELETQDIKSEITPADIEKAAREFWAFQAPQIQQSVATASEALAGWSQNRIDDYVWQRRAAQGLEPAADADPHTLLRRLCMDLVGLPPTPEQIDYFLDQWKSDPQAAVALVADTLLNNPQYGERWGRHWLDVARYAESSGKERNLTFPHAWRYRDYVIDSFNEDKRYDRFLIEQVAGDLLPAINDDDWTENTIATGFLALGAKTLVEQNKRQFQLDLVDEQIDVTTRVFLGMSIACARCHDHKFDPFPQTDYYALAGIFQSTQTMYGTVNTAQNRNPGQLIRLDENQQSLTPDISAEQLEKLRDGLAEKLREANELRQRLRGRDRSSVSQADVRRRITLQQEVGVIRSAIESYDNRGNAYTFCMGVQPGQPEDARLLVRGEFNQPAQLVSRAMPQVLTTEKVNIPADATGRLEFARWMAAEDNPLTARVMVNRVWLHLFGEGLVRTPENFGVTGQEPTHPELLDYLAVRFMENGWSIKKLIREIVTSRTYRMASKFDGANFEKDPGNNFLWRYPPRRLDAEVIRDSMLAASGQLGYERPLGSLVAELGNATIREGNIISTVVADENDQPNRRFNRPAQNNQSMQRGRLASLGGLMPKITPIDQPATYRSVYLPIVRDYVPRSLEVFDFAESSMVIGKRESSNTPDQGLYLLNNEFVLEQSDAMARRVLEFSDNRRRQVEYAFVLAYGRPPTAGELNTGVNFLRRFDVTEETSASDRNNFNSRSNRTSRADALRNAGRRIGNRGRIQNNPYTNERADRNSAGKDAELRKLSALCQALFASAEFRFMN